MVDHGRGGKVIAFSGKNRGASDFFHLYHRESIMPFRSFVGDGCGVEEEGGGSVGVRGSGKAIDLTQQNGLARFF